MVGERRQVRINSVLSFCFFPRTVFSNLATNCQRWINCNSHDMKFTLLKVYSSLVFSAFTKFCSHYHHTVAEHFHQRETPHTLAAMPFPTHSPAPLSPGCFMSVWICLLWMLHINKILPYMAFKKCT